MSKKKTVEIFSAKALFHDDNFLNWLVDLHYLYRCSYHVPLVLYYRILLFNGRCCCYAGHRLKFLMKCDNVVFGPFCKTTCSPIRGPLFKSGYICCEPQPVQRSNCSDSSIEQHRTEINLCETCCCV